MKKLILSLILSFGTVCAFAESATWLVVTNGLIAPNGNAVFGNGTNLVNGPGVITGFVVQNTNEAINTTFTIYDAPRTNTAGNQGAALSWINAAYTTFTSFITNRYLGNYTNYWGGTNYTRYASNVLYTVTNTVAAGTNNFRAIYTGVAVSNATTTLTVPAAGWPYGMGISIFATGGKVLITPTYDRGL